MQIRLFSALLLLLLAFTSFSCTSNKEDEPEPLKDIVGRWDVQSRRATVYDDKGNVDYTTNMPGKPGDYYIYNSDKTFEIHFDGFASFTSGTYTYTNTSVTTKNQQGVLSGYDEITTFTPMQLVFTNGKQQTGTRSVVDVITLIKH
jgi:hypothetical protein